MRRDLPLRPDTRREMLRCGEFALPGLQIGAKLPGF